MSQYVAIVLFLTALCCTILSFELQFDKVYAMTSGRGLSDVTK